MGNIKLLALFSLLLPFLVSCNKDLNVNADWKDITVVYGLLDQSKDTTYIKVTKAFLGEGDALHFSKIPDSSNYPDKLEVRLDEYADTTFLRSYQCDTVTVHNKEAGDSVFYYPDQLMYYTTAKLNENYIYKLYIRNKATGKVVTAQTGLLHDFVIMVPQNTASFPPGKSFQVKWKPAVNGKRYQLVIRFYYREALISDYVYHTKSIDWIVFQNYQPVNIASTMPIDLYFPGDGFYSAVGRKIPVDPLVTRDALWCNFIFTVAAPELNTYMEVTEPSLSLIQERPSYTNIVNGIGIFSARYIKSADSLGLSQLTIEELRVNKNTKDLGF